MIYLPLSSTKHLPISPDDHRRLVKQMRMGDSYDTFLQVSYYTQHHDVGPQDIRTNLARLEVGRDDKELG
jgi:hypothetical protein